ncbi:sulfonate ABC transporter ATP-binding protein [Verrucomicrobia bacterium LW23]|nr:sulfonate ABC transporter ATP-binding protein [Verrucomicrobia bacterium LW23]
MSTSAPASATHGFAPNLAAAHGAIAEPRIVAPSLGYITGPGAAATAGSPSVSDDSSADAPPLSGSVEFREVGIRFGSGAAAVQAVRGINLSIRAGEFVSILGPSGCGKSTLIGALAGFTAPSEGSLFVDGQRVTRPGSDRGVVFQYHNLFPWKTVAGNVEFGLKMRGVGRPERQAVTAEILQRVGLAEFARHYPAQLSGGMQQRVSLARVLVNRPRLLLMDEPFSALDAQCRLLMQELLLELWREFRTTVVFVTHDIDEAIFLADRVILVSPRPGRITGELPVTLPRPRTAEAVTTAEFLSLKRTCFGHLRG